MPQGLSPIIHRCCAVPQQEHVGKSGSWGWSMLVAVASPSALHAGKREPQAPAPNTSAGVNNTHNHSTWTKSGASSGRIAHHTATCSWTVCLTKSASDEGNLSVDTTRETTQHGPILVLPAFHNCNTRFIGPPRFPFRTQPQNSGCSRQVS